MFGRALSEIIPKGKGLVGSVHPGIVFTNMIRNMYTGVQLRVIDLCRPVVERIFMKSHYEGGQTTLFVLYGDIGNIESGAYYAECAKSK
jgi:hypothetical protein